jgi:protein lifeguard
MSFQTGKTTQYKNLDAFLPSTPDQSTAVMGDSSNDQQPIEIQTVFGNVITPGKAGYIFNVLNYIIGQLLITTFICSFAYGYKNKLHSYIYFNPGIVLLPIISSLLSLFLLYCIKNKSVRLCLFVIFTLSMSFMASFIIIRFSSNVIYKTVLITTCVVFSTNIYAYYCAKNNRKFSYLETGLFTGFISLIILGFLQIFIQGSFLQFCITMLGVMIFTGLLFYDLNRLYNETTSEDDALMVAITIYLDIINLFLYLLDLIRCLIDKN